MAEADSFARRFIADDWRDGDTFADANPPPDGATPIEQLAAFTGRTVRPHLRGGPTTSKEGTS